MQVEIGRLLVPAGAAGPLRLWNPLPYLLGQGDGITVGGQDAAVESVSADGRVIAVRPARALPALMPVFWTPAHCVGYEMEWTAARQQETERLAHAVSLGTSAVQCGAPSGDLRLNVHEDVLWRAPNLRAKRCGVCLAAWPLPPPHATTLATPAGSPTALPPPPRPSPA